LILHAFHSPFAYMPPGGPDEFWINQVYNLGA
jgi:hypothetical protein